MLPLSHKYNKYLSEAYACVPLFSSTKTKPLVTNDRNESCIFTRAFVGPTTKFTLFAFWHGEKSNNSNNNSGNTIEEKQSTHNFVCVLTLLRSSIFPSRFIAVCVWLNCSPHFQLRVGYGIEIAESVAKMCMKATIYHIFLCLHGMVCVCVYNMFVLYWRSEAKRMSDEVSALQEKEQTTQQSC